MKNALDQWLDLAEQHARQLVNNRGEMNIRTLRSRFHAMSNQSHQMNRLLRTLLTTHTMAELDALYNERCAPIIGRRVQR
jgi:hypothetical protein